jgi:hypothetical protein
MAGGHGGGFISVLHFGGFFISGDSIPIAAIPADSYRFRYLQGLFALATIVVCISLPPGLKP